MAVLAKAFAILLLLQFSRALRYIPENKIIEVVDKGEYTFGLQEELEDDFIERCYYQADTGQQGGFDIITPDFRVLSKREAMPIQEEMNNVITTLGIKQKCQINVMKVTDKGPAKWTITPAHYENVDGEKKKEVNGTGVEFSVHFFYHSAILQNTIPVLNGKSFFNHLVTPKGVTLESCELKVKDVVIPIDLQGEKLKPIEGLDIAVNIAALGHGLCGFKYVKVVYEEVNYLTWILMAKSADGKYYRNEFVSKVQNDVGLYHQTRSVVLGTALTVQCGPQFIMQYCTLFNPQNEVVPTGGECKYIINSFAFEHLGTWRCFSGDEFALEPTEYSITYVSGVESTVVPIVEEYQDSIRIGCKVTNYGMGEMSRCTLFAPNHRPFNVKYGGASERYTTLGTNYNDAVCLMEIKKPLVDFENGYWKCEIVGPNRYKFGGTYLKVGNAKIPPYRKHKQLTTELNKTATIFCEVPYSTDYCFIISPNGTRYENEKKTHTNLGQCAFTISHAYPSDNGTWTCTYARHTGLPNENIIVEVLVSDILHAYQNVEVDLGNNAQLLCHTGGLPMAYCQFTAPNGSIYHLRKEDSSTGVRYYGKGLERGDCGMLLLNSHPEDSGVWRCSVALVRDPKRSVVSAPIALTVVSSPDINVAGVGIGVIVVIILVASIAGLFIYRRWKRKRHQEVPSSHDVELQGDNVSSSSSTD